MASPPLFTIFSRNIVTAHTMTSVISGSTGSFSFIDLIDRYVPVQSSLLRQLEIRDIISLSRTCKRLNHVYDTTLKTQYNINEWLKPLIRDPVGFRNVQAGTGALIVMEVAFQFFLRKPQHDRIPQSAFVFVSGDSAAERLSASLPVMDG
jgi:hypothetical protein